MQVCRIYLFTAPRVDPSSNSPLKLGDNNAPVEGGVDCNPSDVDGTIVSCTCQVTR